MKNSIQLIFILFLTLTQVLTQTSAPYRNIMYFGEWSIYSDFYPSKMNAKLLTHIYFAFLDLDANGDLVLCDEYADFQTTSLPELDGMSYAAPYAGVLGALAILKIKNPHLKVGISVGGWTRSGDFPGVAASETKRRNFAKNMAKFINYIGYDLVDIDWEYPTAKRDPSGGDEGCRGTDADTENFTYLLQALREELDALGKQNNKHYELTIATSADPGMMSKIQFDKVLKYIDFANVMTYDMNGGYNSYTAHHTNLYTNPNYDSSRMWGAVYSVDYALKYLKNTYGNNINYSQILVGVAPYTYGWAGVKNDGLDPNNPGLYASASPNSISDSYGFHQIAEMKEKYGLTEYFDETAQAAYYYNPSGGYFFTIDNERSVAAKGNYVKQNGLGGLFAWMASLDGENVITKAMFNSLYGEGYVIPDDDLIFTNVESTATISANDNGYDITIKNLESIEESNTALKDAELLKKSILFMKLYIKSKSGAKFSAGSMSGTVTNKDGYGVVDPSSNYDAKNIAPGGSYSFSVRVDRTPDVSDIESITMTQRILPTLGEIKKQVVYPN